MEEEYCYLSLHCKHCDCPPKECSEYPYAMCWVNKEGCTRKVTKEEKDKFKYYMEEVLPFINTYKSEERKKEMYKEIDDFLMNIYKKPLGHRLDKKGKIKLPKL